MINIILIGMPGCGKSTVGVVLAKSLGFSFVDTDLLIQEREKKLLQEILDVDGLSAFLNVEESVLLSLNCSKTVIATGGSSVYSEKGMIHLKKNGIIIYLSLPCEEIEKRLTNIKTRGIADADTKTIREIFNERTPLYEKYADITVHTKNIYIPESIEIIKLAISEKYQKTNKN